MSLLLASIHPVEVTIYAIILGFIVLAVVLSAIVLSSKSEASLARARCIQLLAPPLLVGLAAALLDPLLTGISAEGSTGFRAWLLAPVAYLALWLALFVALWAFFRPRIRVRSSRRSAATLLVVALAHAGALTAAYFTSELSLLRHFSIVPAATQQAKIAARLEALGIADLICYDEDQSRGVLLSTSGAVQLLLPPVDPETNPIPRQHGNWSRLQFDTSSVLWANSALLAVDRWRPYVTATPSTAIAFEDNREPYNPSFGHYPVFFSRVPFTPGRVLVADRLIYLGDGMTIASFSDVTLAIDLEERTIAVIGSFGFQSAWKREAP